MSYQRNDADLEARARQLVASWPALTDAQLDRVAAILRGGAAQ